MKIGLYGGIANNIYVFAKALAGANADICFIRDRFDKFPFSQPAWEDVEFRLAYADVAKASGWSWDQWTMQEDDIGWTAPTWLYDTLNAKSNASKHIRLPRNPWDAFGLSRFIKSPGRAAVIEKMRQCDCLLVCGIEGSILASLSGRPYIMWPHGADLMIAAGLLSPPWYRIRQSIAHGILRRQLKAAFSSAICVGNHEPTGITTDYYGAENYIRRLNVVFMPIPIPIRPRPTLIQRKQALRQLLNEMGHVLPDGAVVGFVPSRLDYEWKGQDRLLRALSDLHAQGRAKNLCLVFSGWGTDFLDAQRYANEQGISDRLFFLDSALSKPLLFRYYLAADFVVDQFINGMYGTSALEAMACGAPLLTWLSEAYDRPWGRPPVIQARSSEEIAKALADIAEGRHNLEETGNALQVWLGRVHNPAAVVESLIARFSGA